jgi:hypothetical protein
MKEIELYQNIMVYQNVFDNPEKMFEIIRESSSNNSDRILGEWSQWSEFGNYIKDVFPSIAQLNPKTNKNTIFDFETINDLSADTYIKKDQKYFLLEMHRGFNKVTEAYILKYGKEFNFNKEEMIQTHDGDYVPLWVANGPSLCQYHKNIETPMSMVYHSDYIREPMRSPGYKFAITANYYFNDDYEGGEIDFYIDGNLIKYKPQAGDWLVFPSGHPDVLSKNGKAYIHGVFPSYGKEKYFCRNYWQKYEVGDPHWFSGEEKYGKEVWASMQDDIMKDYRPVRQSIPEGVRVR